MADIDLTQQQADALMAMETRREDDKQLRFPGPGEQLAISLTSLDKRENFMLDVTRAQIKVTKATYQNRARVAVVLMRLDIDGPPHRNPDGVEIPCPHLHIYREGHGAKWAFPLPVDRYIDTQNLFLPLRRSCNIATSQFRRHSPWGFFNAADQRH